METLIVPSCPGILDCFNTRLSRYYKEESKCCLQGKANTLFTLALFSFLYIHPEVSTNTSAWTFKVSAFKKYIGYVGGTKSKDLYALFLEMETSTYIWDYSPYSPLAKVSFNAEKTFVTVQSNYFRLLLQHMKTYSSKRNQWGKKISAGQSTYSSMVYTSILKERSVSAVEVVIELVKLVERRGPLLFGENAHISTKALVERCPTLYQQVKNTSSVKERTRIVKNTIKKGLELMQKHTNIYNCFSDLYFELPKKFSVNTENQIIITYLRRNIL